MPMIFEPKKAIGCFRIELGQRCKYWTILDEKFMFKDFILIQLRSLQRQLMVTSPMVILFITNEKICIDYISISDLENWTQFADRSWSAGVVIFCGITRYRCERDGFRG